MFGSRRIKLAVVAVGLAVLPACVTHVATTAPPEGSAVVAPPPRVRDFAIYAPGQRVPAHEPDPAPLRPVTPHDVPQPVSDPPPAQPGSLPPLALIPPPDAPLIAAVRAYLANRPDQAVEHLKGLDKPNQDFVLQLLPVVAKSAAIDFAKATPLEIGVMQRTLDDSAATLAPRAPLTVEKAVFCRWVKTFGRYDPLPDRTPFKPRAVAELYVEVKNAPSIPVTTTDDGDGYLTHLACTLQLRDSADQVIEMIDRSRKPVPVIQDSRKDFTRSPIRDYFLLLRFEVPNEPGQYTVTFEIRDPVTIRSVSKTMGFRVQ